MNRLNRWLVIFANIVVVTGGTIATAIQMNKIGVEACGSDCGTLGFVMTLGAYPAVIWWLMKVTYPQRP